MNEITKFFLEGESPTLSKGMLNIYLKVPIEKN